MEITPLEIGAAVAVVCLLFGPRKFPKFNKPKPAANWQTLTAADLGHSNYAAARAPSPLSARRTATPEHQFAVVGTSRPAPLPHELLF